jgi:hypothetical protein
LPRVDTPCRKEGQQACTGERTVLACTDLVWVEMKCRGPAGCKAKGDDDADCDQAIADEGEACALAEDFTCSHDQKLMLRCERHFWRSAATCEGARGCVIAPKKITCDNTLASEGDLCREEGDYACSKDGKTALGCRNGRFELASSCDGPKACAITGPVGAQKVQCDDSIADLGSPCDKEGHYACLRDRSRIIQCRAHVFVADDKCKKTERCAVKSETVGCY